MSYLDRSYRRSTRAAWAAVACSLAAALAAGPLPAQAAVGFEVVFDDVGGTYAGYYGDIERMVRSTGADWVGHLAGPVADTTLTVEVGFAPVSTANGRSQTSAFLGLTAQGLSLYEEGAAHKLRTGVDVNGATPDISFHVGINGYLQSELWFDPDPMAQTAAVPSGKTDARSVFLHEFGHALGFNGWRDGADGDLPGNHLSRFDELVALAPGNTGPLLYFNGPAATALYGGPVPLTFNNYGHVANAAPQAGADLLPDLMNGVAYFRGTRYQISALDMAVLQDLGLPVQAPVPEPASLAMLLAGLLLLYRRVRPSGRRR